MLGWSESWVRPAARSESGPYLRGNAGASWRGTRSGAASNTERGIAYNPVTKHVLVVSRQAPIGVHILDADTGAEIPSVADPSVPKTLDMTGISGGTFIVDMAGVGDDGVIYVGNLTT